jgi:UDP-glucose 4-epimerase
VYIDDVADFLLRVITWGKNATVYNVGSGVASTLNEVLEEIKHVSGKSPQVHYQPSRVFDVPHVVLNITRAHEELGWEPRYSLRDGITLLYERIIMQHV